MTGQQHTPSVGSPVVLVPDVRVATGWGLVALLAAGIAVWLVVATRIGAGGVLLLAASLLVAVALLRQAVAPASCAVVVDERGVRGWQLVRRLEVEGLRQAALTSWWGEDVLRVRDSDGVRRSFLLPVGCDTSALRLLLAERDAPLPPPIWSGPGA